MTHTLYGHLVSTKTLVRIGFAVLSLYSIGTAFAQGLSAGTMAPVYGSTWAAARAGFRDPETQNAALESARAAAARAPETTGHHARPSSPRTGG